MPTLTLALIFMGMFSLISVLELAQQALGPALTIWGSRFVTIVFAGISAAFIAFFPLRSLRDAEAKFRAIYEDSHDAILLLDENRFLDCNRQALHMFGISGIEEMKPSHPAGPSPQFQPDGRASPEALRDHIRTAFRDGYAHFEWVYTRNNGEPFSADVLLSSFSQGDGQVLQATIRDISEQKRAKAALQESNDRFFSYIRETALRMKIPVEVVHENIVVVIDDIESDKFQKADILLLLRIQEKNLAQIRQNILELNRKIIDHFGDIPPRSKRLFTE